MKGAKQGVTRGGKTMLRAIRAVDYIILLCQDIERMKRFYQEVLILMASPWHADACRKSPDPVTPKG